MSSLYGALFSGVSGLNAQATAMGVISDNISNVNTVGYKEGTTQFETLVTDQISATTYSPGGVQSRPQSLISGQGLLQSTSSSTDLAINGNGFFPVAPSSTSTDRLYTRAGNFVVDKNGYLVNAAGFNLLGQAVPAGTSAAAAKALQASTVPTLTAVQIQTFASTATKTTTADLNANLDATAAAATTFSATAQVFDSNGVATNIPLTITKQAAANTWIVTQGSPTFASSGAANGAVAGAAASTTIVFASGLPNAAASIALTGTYGDGSAYNIAVNLGSANTADGITQFGSQSYVSSYSQNGSQSGNFIGVSVDKNGLVFAQYDNGQNNVIYKVPVVTFENANGLAGQNGNVYRESQNSGTSLSSTAGTGGAGTISPSTLESSTVDLATEFSNMIITQRAYSANGKIITTVDQMLDELIQLKR